MDLHTKNTAEKTQKPKVFSCNLRAYLAGMTGINTGHNSRDAPCSAGTVSVPSSVADHRGVEDIFGRGLLYFVYNQCTDLI